MGRWGIERVGDVHVVTMASNAVNAMDDDFCSDLQAAIAELQSAEPLPVVLTGSGTCSRQASISWHSTTMIAPPCEFRRPLRPDDARLVFVPASDHRGGQRPRDRWRVRTGARLRSPDRRRRRFSDWASMKSKWVSHFPASRSRSHDAPFRRSGSAK